MANKHFGDCAFGCLWFQRNNIHMAGEKSFVTFVDILSKNVWVYMLKSSGGYFEKFKEFNAFAKRKSKYQGILVG